MASRSATRVGKCRYSVPEPTPASRAMSSRDASGPSRAMATRAASRSRSTLRLASARWARGGWMFGGVGALCAFTWFRAFRRLQSRKRGRSPLVKRGHSPYITPIQTETVPGFLYPSNQEKRNAPQSDRTPSHERQRHVDPLRQRLLRARSASPYLRDPRWAPPARRRVDVVAVDISREIPAASSSYRFEEADASAA